VEEIKGRGSVVLVVVVVAVFLADVVLVAALVEVLAVEVVDSASVIVVEVDRKQKLVHSKTLTSICL
jgi:hypothetical protein